MSLFLGRELVIATMHKKENVIGPLVASKLGVRPFAPENINTDSLGTFTGEVERKADPLTTARQKCEIAMELTGCDLAIASEGSFGMHPSLIFVPGNEELVILIDKKNNLEIIGKKLSTETNFDAQLCENWEDLEAFAKKVHFPEHGLIIRNTQNDITQIHKGISNWVDLKKAFEQIKKNYNHAYVETDMRALYNPTRMNVISEATENMLYKALTTCEKCNTPGFGVTDIIQGLPCESCNEPTQSIMFFVNGCTKCGFSIKSPNPDKISEDPMYCNYCNP